MFTKTSNITFKTLFTFTSQINFEPDSSFNSVLQNLESGFSDTLTILITFTPTATDLDSTITANHLQPKTAIIYFATANTSSSISANHIKPKTATIAKTLSNCTSVFTAKFYWFTGSFNATLLTLTPSITARLLYYTVTLTPSLSSLTGAFVSRFYYFTGTFSSTFINTAVNIHGGSTLVATLNSTLNSIITTISLKVPIAITCTIAKTLGNVVRNVITAKVWPTGRYIKTLSNLTGIIYGTLPVVITGSWASGLNNLQGLPIFRLYVAPVGHLTRSLDVIFTTIYLKVPIHIYVNMLLFLTPVTTSIKIKVALYVYILKTFGSISLGWFGRTELPRDGLMGSILTCTGLIYAKISNHGSFTAILKSLTTTVYLKVPIRIFITWIPVLKPVVNVYYGKVAIGGHLVPITNATTSRIFVRVLIGGTIEFNSVDVTSLITIKVPLPVAFSFNKTLLPIVTHISGKGHYRPMLNTTLASLICGIRLQVLNTLGTLNLTKFDGPFITINKFYNAFLGEKYPYRSGKYWRLQIFGNNGDQNATSFKQIKLFKLTPNGELVNILEGVVTSSNFFASNAEYTDSDGMLWNYQGTEDIEIRSYSITGI